jgi:serine/threonine protein kinase
LKEIKFLQNSNHINIIKLLDVFYKRNLLYFSLESGIIDLGDLLIKEKERIPLEPQHVKCLAK